MIQVEIDPNSGFCGGVIRAIGTAEQSLAEDGRLYSLGAIVHNEEELARLEARGLVTIDTETLRAMRGPVSGESLLIRAHGEPPQVYDRVRELGFRLIDCTCPVVLGLQKKIREAHARLAASGGQIVIFGKIGHPEVLGLVGQVDGGVTVVENLLQLQEKVAAGEIRTDRDIELFSQTTMSPEGYAQVCDALTNEELKFIVASNRDTVRLKEYESIDGMMAMELLNDPQNKGFTKEIVIELCRNANIALMRFIAWKQNTENAESEKEG